MGSHSLDASSGFHLDIHPHAYELWLDGRLLARLDGGAAALLAGAGERLRPIDIETAIERSEDWLMPSSKAFHGRELQVRDATGRVAGAFSTQPNLAPDDVEAAFTRAFDAVSHGRNTAREGVAHIVLLRELVHHGRLPAILVD